MRDQIQIIVVDPDDGEVVGHAQCDTFFSGFEALEGLEPHMKDVLRKQFLEITFHGLPAAGREGQSRHKLAEGLGLFTIGTGWSGRTLVDSGSMPSGS